MRYFSSFRRGGEILCCVVMFMSFAAPVSASGEYVSVLNPGRGVTLDKTADAATVANLKRHVDKLVNEFGSRNYSHVENLDKAAGYINGEFVKSGCSTSRQVVPVRGKNYQNVIAKITGKTDKKIIIGAHYDTAGSSPGADDNTSAVAGMLELARLLAKAEPEHTIEFIAYCNEEPPFFDTRHMGSVHHARLASNRKDRITAMICLEMIGYYSDKPNSQEYPVPGLEKVLPSVGNFIGVVGNEASMDLAMLVQGEMNKYSSLPVARANLPASLGLCFDFSDHRSYWQKKYKAIMITDTAMFRNPNYHKETDTPDTLDYRRMADVVNALYKAVLVLDRQAAVAGEKIRKK